MARELRRVDDYTVLDLLRLAGNALVNVVRQPFERGESTTESIIGRPGGGRTLVRDLQGAILREVTGNARIDEADERYAKGMVISGTGELGDEPISYQGVCGFANVAYYLRERASEDGEVRDYQRGIDLRGQTNVEIIDCEERTAAQEVIQRPQGVLKVEKHCRETSNLVEISAGRKADAVVALGDRVVEIHGGGSYRLTRESYNSQRRLTGTVQQIASCGVEF